MKKSKYSLPVLDIIVGESQKNRLIFFERVFVLKILLEVAYDGFNYHGLQRQDNAITIQQKIEDALFKIYNEEITLILASRTDSQVHALGQRVSFDADDIIIPCERLHQVINRYLPDDIVCIKAEIVPDDFHPRYDAKSKLYNYKILNTPFPIPQYRNYMHFYPYQLDFSKMCEACNYFLGTHDFVAFSAKGSSVISTTRTIYTMEMKKENDNIISVDISGDGFLYNMVRIMIGTLLDVGRGKKNPEDIEKIILSKDRTNAGRTAKPYGLTLIKIFY